MVGRKVVNNSVTTFLFSLMAMNTMLLFSLLARVRFVAENIVRSLSSRVRLEKSFWIFLYPSWRPIDKVIHVGFLQLDQ